MRRIHPDDADARILAEIHTGLRILEITTPGFPIGNVREYAAQVYAARAEEEEIPATQFHPAG